MNFLEFAPLVGALGVGSVVGNWFGGGRSRREVRSAVLNSIAATESNRWATDPNLTDFREFTDSVRNLETAALIARVPRRAVLHYVVLAHAARQLSDDAVDYLPAENDFWGPIDGYFDSVVRDAAKVLTGLAWRPLWTRLVLPVELINLRNRAAAFDDEKIRWRLAAAQKVYGALPGDLGRIPGIEDPPRTVEPLK